MLLNKDHACVIIAASHIREIRTILLIFSISCHITDRDFTIFKKNKWKQENKKRKIMQREQKEERNKT